MQGRETSDARRVAARIAEQHVATQQSLTARTQDSFDPAALAGVVLPGDGTPATDAANALDTRCSSTSEVNNVLQVFLSSNVQICWQSNRYYRRTAK